jgi:hypothetical protein
MEKLLPVHRAAIDKVFIRWLRLYYGGMAYCALSGLRPEEDAKPQRGEIT